MSASLTKSDPPSDSAQAGGRPRIWHRLGKQSARRNAHGIDWTNSPHGTDRSDLNSHWPGSKSSAQVTVAVPVQQRGPGSPSVGPGAADRRDHQLVRPARESSAGLPGTRLLTSSRLLIVGDLAATLAWVLVWGYSSPPYVLAAAITIGLCASGGLYRPRLHVSLLDQLPNLLGRLGIATAGAAVITNWFTTEIDLHEYVDRCAVLVITHVTVRGLACMAIRATRARGTVSHPTLIVGSSTTCHKVTTILDDNPMYGLQVVGYLGEPSPAMPDTRGWRSLGDVQQIVELIEEHNITVVVLDDDIAGYSGAVEALRTRMGLLQSLFVVPRIIEAGVTYDLHDHIGAIPVLRVKGSGPSAVQRVSKRCFDIVLAVTCLILLSPAMAAIAAAVYAEDRQSVLFRQIRVGLNGRKFLMYKFRSMRPAAPHAPDTQWTAESRQRISRVGQVLRKTSLDELPQLFNILKGDMTFVGPRPERPHFVEQFSASLPHYQYRHRVQVGLTGLAQVSGLRGDTSIDDRARHDNYYIDHWNLWYDLKVILWTLGQVVRAKGG